MESISEDEQSSSSLSNSYITQEEKNKKLITIGECSIFYLYLLGATICQVISILILGGFEENIGLFGFSPILNSYSLMQSIYTYIGYLIFSPIFRCISKRNERKVNIQRKSLLIHNDLTKLNYKKLYLQIFLVSFCFGFYSEILNILYDQGFQLLNYWTFETIFTFLLVRKYFEVDIYKHHRFSIYFIVITCSIFLLVASLLPESSGKEEQFNTYQNINNKLGSYYYSIIIIIFFIFLSFIFAFSRTFSKILMQIKSLSNFILIFAIGINGLIISIISSIILYYMHLENNILQYFIDLNNCEKDYKFYLEIFLITPIFIFIQFMQLYFEILVIFYLNPIYALAINNLTFGSTKLVSFIANASANVIHFLFSELSEVFAIIGYIFYLEILELNFCGLSDNIKRNIVSKGQNEFNKLYIYKLRNTHLFDIIEDEGEKENTPESKKNLEMAHNINDENE